MKKTLCFLSVVLVLVLSTGGYAYIKSDNCKTYSNDPGITAAPDNCSGYICDLRGGFRTGSGTNGGGAATSTRTGRPSQPPADDGPPLGPIGPIFGDD